MSNMLLGVSPDFLYLHNEKPKLVSDYHRPYFLVFCPNFKNIKSARMELINEWKNNTSDENVLSKIEKIGDIEIYRSFWNYNKTREIFKVYTKQSYLVPEVSDYLFFNYGFYTAEHDIPYHQRSLVDIAANEKIWLFNTSGRKEKLKVFIYDIETTQFQQGFNNIPIDIIGYTNFNITFNSDINLNNEEFNLNIIDCPSHSEDINVIQLISRNIDEEIKNLFTFCKLVKSFDIISGHNIAGFDNQQIHNRLNWILKNYQSRLSKDERNNFKDFLNRYSRKDRSFHFGVGSEVVNFYPCTFDTYLATRKFYSFLDSFSLKSVAPFLGVGIKDRIILSPSQIRIDNRTLKYNKQDIIEQTGVTLNLIQQALPLSFTTCMTFDNLLSSGAVNMWDHMSLIRGSLQKKIMPPICRVSSISQVLLRDFKYCKTKEEIIKHGKKIREHLSKEFVRVLKYGEEMPEWMKYPYVIYNEDAKDADERLNYHMPGGMTIKPDKEAKSHFIPWWFVIVADVGAMYPTILKAMNVGADTVRLCPKSKKADEWIWLKKLPKKFLDNKLGNLREITKNDSFADEGYKLDITIDKNPGVVNCAMTGIMSMISKIKKNLKEIEKSGDNSELKRLKMMYQSLKGARNAGSVDYSQRILLQKIDKTFDKIMIGEFVDNAIKRYGCRIEKINDTYFEIADIKDNLGAISINKNGKIEVKRVKHAIRHKWKDKLVKITTKNGFTVVTPNHSIFTIRNEKIEEVAAGDINYNTLIVHVRDINKIIKNNNYLNNNKNNNIVNLMGKPVKEKILHYGINNDYNDAFIETIFKKIECVGDCYAIPPTNIELIDPTSKYVYDISVEDNENFLNANGGILLHNTHGILAAPNVSGRQFNLWGAAAITTKGQMILADTLNSLEKKGIRVVYGDTDGIYIGCSRSAGNLPNFSKALGILFKDNEEDWLTKPEDVISAIKNCNTKWQNELKYPDFELEPEIHDGMIFVKHKNYLIFDEKDGKIEMITKGNNFKGSDKANIARKVLKDIMINVLKEKEYWNDEIKVRNDIKKSIKSKTKEIIRNLDLSKVDIDDLILLQSVKPAKQYKKNQDGSMSTFGKRAAALEKLLGRPIKSTTKIKFVVTKRSLPGIVKPSKSGVKPIDYMYPIDMLNNVKEIDLKWYKNMIENYIQGAFGLSIIEETEQKGLDSWM